MGTCNLLQRWLLIMGFLSLSSVLLPAATAEAQEEGLERGSQLITKQRGEQRHQGVRKRLGFRGKLPVLLHPQLERRSQRHLRHR